MIMSKKEPKPGFGGTIRTLSCEGDSARAFPTMFVTIEIVRSSEAAKALTLGRVVDVTPR